MLDGEDRLSTLEACSRSRSAAGVWSRSGHCRYHLDNRYRTRSVGCDIRCSKRPRLPRVLRCGVRLSSWTFAIPPTACGAAGSAPILSALPLVIGSGIVGIRTAQFLNDSLFHMSDSFVR